MRLLSLRQSTLSLLLVTTALAQAPVLPALMIEALEVSDTDLAAYTRLVARANTAMRERHGVPLFLRAYTATSITGEPSATFALSPSGSFAGLMANRAAFATDSELSELRSELNALTTPAPATYLKTIRFDGTNTPGWLCNSMVRTTDESALLARVEALAAGLSLPDMSPPLINVFRILAGSYPATHLVSINAQSGQHLALLLDSLITAPNPLSLVPIEIVDTKLYHELIE